MTLASALATIPLVSASESAVVETVPAETVPAETVPADKEAHNKAAIEEVVVTAGFRDSRLFGSAVSVSVVDDASIRDRGALHVESVLNLAPNVSFSSGSSRARFVQMRGVGDLEQFVDPKHYASVGITLDDISLSGTANAAMLMDAQQVEILRGPQGTRFGNNALAGMVNIKSNAPTEQFEAYVEGGAGNYRSAHLGAVVSGPLSSDVLGRVAVKKQISDGFIENDYQGKDDTNNIDELAARTQLRWLASDSAQIDFSAMYFHSKNGYDAFSLDNNRHTLSDEPGHDELDFLALSMNGLWELNNQLSLNIIASTTDSESNYAYDEDWANAGICDGLAECDPFSNTDTLVRDQDSHSLDIRLLSNSKLSQVGDIQAVLGLYGEQRSEQLARDYYGRFVSDYDTDRVAIYGELEVLLSPQLHLITGLRAERFEDNYSDLNAYGGRFTSAEQENLFSGEVTLQYFTAQDYLLYATVSRGNKPGGVNTEASSTFAYLQGYYQDFLSPRLNFASESLLNKELGFKGAFMANRLALRAAIFHMERKNAQLESWLLDYGVDGDQFYWVGFLDTASRAENYGAEIEADLNINECLSLFGGFAWLETNVDALTVYDVDTYAFVDVKDRDQTKSPELQYSVGAQLQLSQSITTRVELEGRDAQNFGYYHNKQLASYHLLHASMSYLMGDLELRIWGRNLMDKDYAVHGLYFGNDPRTAYASNSYRQLGEPRTYGVSAKYKF
jgi:outer membrane receptor protein involved in Fe transport